jgi:DNA polymerase III subunit epsilon
MTNKSLIALDLETTGLSPTRHKILEIAAVPFDVDGTCAEDVLHLTGVELQAPPRSLIRPGLSDLLRMIGDDSTLITHNAAFDLAFLAEAFRRARVRSFSLRAYCTLRLARAMLPARSRYDLGSLRKALDLPARKSHVALDDARTVAALFTALVHSTGCGDEQTLRALHGPPLQVRSRSAVTGSVVSRVGPNGQTASLGMKMEASLAPSFAGGTGRMIA